MSTVVIYQNYIHLKYIIESGLDLKHNNKYTIYSMYVYFTDKMIIDFKGYPFKIKIMISKNGESEKSTITMNLKDIVSLLNHVPTFEIKPSNVSECWYVNLSEIKKDINVNDQLDIIAESIKHIPTLSDAQLEIVYDDIAEYFLNHDYEYKFIPTGGVQFDIYNILHCNSVIPYSAKYVIRPDIKIIEGKHSVGTFILFRGKPTFINQSESFAILDQCDKCKCRFIRNWLIVNNNCEQCLGYK